MVTNMEKEFLQVQDVIQDILNHYFNGNIESIAVVINGNDDMVHTIFDDEADIVEMVGMTEILKQEVLKELTDLDD